MQNHNDADDATVLDVKSQQAPKARLICLDPSLIEGLADDHIVLKDLGETIGRDETNSLPINYKKISKHHARIFPERSSWVIEDLNSTNGVLVNNVRITRQTSLKHGDFVEIGTIRFRYETDDPPPSYTVLANTPETPEGTVYLGDRSEARMVEMLGEKISTETEPQPEPAKKKKTRKESSIKPAARASISYETGTRSVRFGYIIMGLLLLTLMGGGVYYYVSSQKNREVETLEKDYSIQLRKFLKQYESETTPFSQAANADELAQLQELSAMVNVAAKQYPRNAGLAELQARLSFLKFEREFNAALIGKRLPEARKLVEHAMVERATQPAGNPELQNTVNEIQNLLKMAKIAVEFKEFSQRFPNPNDTKSRQPDTYDIRELEPLKDQLAEMTQTHDLLLSVNYPYFQRILATVDEDLHLFNRWREALKGRRPNNAQD